MGHNEAPKFRPSEEKVASMAIKKVGMNFEFVGCRFAAQDNNSNALLSKNSKETLFTSSVTAHAICRVAYVPNIRPFHLR
jgi:hypothetical protein